MALPPKNAGAPPVHPTTTTPASAASRQPTLAEKAKPTVHSLRLSLSDNIDVMVKVSCDCPASTRRALSALAGQHDPRDRCRQLNRLQIDRSKRVQQPGLQPLLGRFASVDTGHAAALRQCHRSTSARRARARAACSPRLRLCRWRSRLLLSPRVACDSPCVNGY